jgi:hypothetical protein
MKQLSVDSGFETVDAGSRTIARLLEPRAMLWMHLAFGIEGQPELWVEDAETLRRITKIPAFRTII